MCVGVQQILADIYSNGKSEANNAASNVLVCAAYVVSMYMYICIYVDMCKFLKKKFFMLVFVYKSVCI